MQKSRLFRALFPSLCAAALFIEAGAVDRSKAVMTDAKAPAFSININELDKKWDKVFP